MNELTAYWLTATIMMVIMGMLESVYAPGMFLGWLWWTMAIAFTTPESMRWRSRSKH